MDAGALKKTTESDNRRKTRGFRKESVPGQGGLVVMRRIGTLLLVGGILLPSLSVKAAPQEGEEEFYEEEIVTDLSNIPLDQRPTLNKKRPTGNNGSSEDKSATDDKALSQDKSSSRDNSSSGDKSTTEDKSVTYDSGTSYGGGATYDPGTTYGGGTTYDQGSSYGGSTTYEQDASSYSNGSYDGSSTEDPMKESLENHYEQVQELAQADKAQIDALEEHIGDINRAMIKTAREMGEVEEKLNQLNLSIENNELSMEDLAEEKKQTAKDLHDFIRASYESRARMSLLANFLQAESFTDFLNRQAFTNEVLKGFYKKLSEYEDLGKLYKKRQAKLKKLKAEAETQEEEYAKLEADYDAKLVELSSALKEAQARFAESQSAVDAVTMQLMAMEEAEKQALEEADEEDLGPYEQGEITEDDGGSYFYDEPYEYTQEELKLLAGLLEAEAGSASYPGMIAVGSVVMNRLEDSRFPNTIPGVIYAPSQFYPAGSGRLAVILARGPAESCYAAAKDVLEGKRNVRNLYFKADWYAREHGIAGINIGGNVFH